MKYIMELFHILTIIIATIVFVGLFTYSAIVYYSGRKHLFPPDMAPCPDGWDLNRDGTCQIPAPGQNANLGYLAQTGKQIYTYNNIKNRPNFSYLPSYFDTESYDTKSGQPNPKLPLGYYTKDIPFGYDIENPQKGSINFTDPGWATYGDPYCEIKRWAQTQNIQWDGMASYNNHC